MDHVRDLRDKLIGFVRAVQAWNDGVRTRFQTTLSARLNGIELTFGYGYYSRDHVLVSTYTGDDPQPTTVDVSTVEDAVDAYLKACGVTHYQRTEPEMSATPAVVAATPVMGLAGLSADDVLVQIRHVVNLLETQGDTVLDIVTGALKMVRYFSTRDMIGVFTELNKQVVNVQALIAAIKAEFGLE